MRHLRQIESESTAALLPLYGDGEARTIVRMLLEVFCAVKPMDYVLEPMMEVDTSAPRASGRLPKGRESRHAGSFDEAMEMALRWRPVQYIIGFAEFYGREFYTCEGVLIPRVETEEFVKRVLDDRPKPQSKIIDIGTGSGCIALSVKAARPDTNVRAIDISEQAAELFEINRSRLGVDVEFSLLDILSSGLDQKYDIILSNPPYVLDSERAFMRSNVLDYEPELALFVPDSDPLKFYRRIAELATESLNSGGRIYFEINEQYGAQTVDMLLGLGFEEATAHRDIFDKFRVVTAVWTR